MTLNTVSFSFIKHCLLSGPTFKTHAFGAVSLSLEQVWLSPVWISIVLGGDVFRQKSQKVLHILHCGFSLDCFSLKQDPVSDLEITILAVISVSALVTLPICNFMTK